MSEGATTTLELEREATAPFAPSNCSPTPGQELRKCEACGDTMTFHDWNWHRWKPCHKHWKELTPAGIVQVSENEKLTDSATP